MVRQYIKTNVSAAMRQAEQIAKDAKETSRLYVRVAIVDERAGCGGYAYLRIVSADLDLSLEDFVERYVKPSAAQAINTYREELAKLDKVKGR